VKPSHEARNTPTKTTSPVGEPPGYQSNGVILVVDRVLMPNRALRPPTYRARGFQPQALEGNQQESTRLIVLEMPEQFASAFLCRRWKESCLRRHRFRSTVREPIDRESFVARVAGALFAFAVSVFACDANAAVSCSAALNTPQKPFRIFGNTYYVGTHGVASILITSDRSDVLIDGDLAQSAPMIADHIRTLGFRIADVRLILNTHVHCDHAGGIAALQHLSGAAVKASPSSAVVLARGGVSPDDPQYGIAAPIGPSANVSVVTDGETLHVGPIALTAHFTPGHTAGGTSWTWISCEKSRCLNIVYGDSLTAVSAPGYRFLDHPAILAQFYHSFGVMERIPCDILVTAHPEVSDLWSRLDKRYHGDGEAMVDSGACRRLAATARKDLGKRLASEKAQ
jgi:metallo-beta-lactamase class B